MILWARIDQPGHESARLTRQGSSWHLDGGLAMIHDKQPVRLDYAIICRDDWQTRSARVTGWVGERDVDVSIEAGKAWRLNGETIPAVAGCIDIDLNFSPSTNLLPIRRLAPKIGESVVVRAAWLRFPSFRLEPLEQTYTRLSEKVYRYESGGGKFVRDLKVNADGFVLDYPGIWRDLISASSE